MLNSEGEAHSTWLDAMLLLYMLLLASCSSLLCCEWSDPLSACETELRLSTCSPSDEVCDLCDLCDRCERREEEAESVALLELCGLAVSAVWRVDE